MDHNATESGLDLFLFGVPLIAMLVFGFFKLDQVFTAHKGSARATRGPSPVIDKNRTSMRSDPDGRSWDDKSPRARRPVRGDPDDKSLQGRRTVPGGSGPGPSRK